MEIEYEKITNRFAFSGAEFSSDKIHWREKEYTSMVYRRAQLSVGILHWHESIEVCRLLSGNAVFDIEGKRYVFKADIHQRTMNHAKYLFIKALLLSMILVKIWVNFST
jgi:hypothetical protein